MSLSQKLRSWLTGLEEQHSGCLYGKDSLPLILLLKKVLSKVLIPEETEKKIARAASDGVVVYAVKQQSQLNTLIIRESARTRGFPRPTFSHDTNMLFWQPFGKALRTILALILLPLSRRRSTGPRERSFVRKSVRRSESVVVHLGMSELTPNKHVEDGLSQLLYAQWEMDRPVLVVPALVSYGRRRDMERESVINILFGQTEGTGTIRRVITFFRYSNKASLVCAEPVNLKSFLADNKDLSREEMINHLRGDLIERIDEEKTATVGPILKSRQEMVSLVLKDEKVRQAIEQRGIENRKGYDAAFKEARRYLNEIASDYSEMFIELWDKVLGWLWNNIYDGVIVDRDGMTKIRNLSKKMPFVVVPCHRSHIDYLLLSYVFYKHNIQMPFIAAGTNMLFWPLGSVFRKSGAFFLRRSFRGNELYGEVFNGYLNVLLKEGLPVEFFIEGGRSRTGKMIMPRYGLLSMIIQAYASGACEDLAIIPVYLGYDRIIEEKAYLKELGGEQKHDESASDVIKSGKVLRKRYGHVYVNIGEPILMKQYLESQEKTYEGMSTEERQRLYRKIGYEIVLNIDQVSVVTPFSLLSAGFLWSDRRGISVDDLMEVLGHFRDYLLARKVRFSETFGDMEKAVTSALGLFEESRLISRVGEDEDLPDEGEEVVYSLPEENRLNLEYYKNNILHYFVPACFLAASVALHREDVLSLQEIMEDYRFFKKMFRHEFIFDDRVDDLDEIREVLLYLSQKGMVSISGGEAGGFASIEVKGKGKRNLIPFAGLIRNYIESYWVVVRACAYLAQGRMPEKDFLKKIRGLGERMFQKGEIRRSEALSQSNYANALRFLEDMGIAGMTEEAVKGEKRPVRYWSLSEDRTLLEGLRRRLFRFL
ncbi:MAG TPA: 1-acyl-sn-glycerol-3-phosphate acyltransferase [Syntrophales bacterium]|nr:1-acyl-sn-glycerol-3-phosphate acyltransferase [Syntrophales bacterium]